MNKLSVIVLFILFFSCGKDNAKVEEEKVSYPFTKEGSLTLAQMDGTPIKTIEIEIADNNAETARGLMNRDSLREDRGMLFLNLGNINQTFYMKNTRIPLDLVYISQDSVVVDIQQGEPYNLETIPSDTVSAYVLELNKGMAEKWGIKENQTKVSWKKD